MSILKGQVPDFETALQDSLDAIADGRRTLDECLAKYPTYAADLAPMLTIAHGLRDGRSVRPSLGFRKQAKSRMQQRIAASTRKPLALVETRKTRQPKRGLFGLPSFALRALIALIVVGMLASVSGVTAYAADSAAPGDALFAVDTTVEQVTLTLTRTADGRLNLQLAIANERMAEAEALINAGQDDYANEALILYDETVVEIEATTDQVDPEDRDEAKDKVKKNLDKHIAKMTELLDKVPPQARQNIERHIQKTIDKANKHNQDGSDDGPGNSGNNGNGNGNGGGNGNGTGGTPSDDDGGSTTSGSDAGDDQANPGNGQGNGNGNGQDKDKDHPGNGNGNGNANGSSDDDNENENENENENDNSSS